MLSKGWAVTDMYIHPDVSSIRQPHNKASCSATDLHQRSECVTKLVLVTSETPGHRVCAVGY
jgi:hypothetical protein